MPSTSSSSSPGSPAKAHQFTGLGTLSGIPNHLLGTKVLGSLPAAQVLHCKQLSSRARHVVETDGAAAAIANWIARSFRWDPPVTQRGSSRTGRDHFPVMPPILLPVGPDTEKRVERFVAASGWEGWRLAEVLRAADRTEAGVLAWAGSPTGGFTRLMQRFCKETESIKVAIESSEASSTPLTNAIVVEVVQGVFEPVAEGPSVHGCGVTQYAKATTIFALPAKADGTVKMLTKAEALVGIWKPGKLRDETVQDDTAPGSGGHLTFKFVSSVIPEIADLGSRQAKRSDKKDKKDKGGGKPSHGRRLVVLALFNALTPPSELGSSKPPVSPLVREMVGYSGPPIALPVDLGARCRMRCLHFGLGKGGTGEAGALARTCLTHLVLDRCHVSVVDEIVAAASPMPLQCLIMRGLHGRQGADLAVFDAAGLSSLRLLHVDSDQPMGNAVALPSNNLAGTAFEDSIEELHLTSDVGVHVDDVAVHLAAFIGKAKRLRSLDIRPASLTYNPGPSKLPEALATCGELSGLKYLGLGRVGDAGDPSPPINAPSLQMLVHQGARSIPLVPKGAATGGARPSPPVMHDFRVQLDSMYHPYLLLANEGMLREHTMTSLPPAAGAKAAAYPIAIDATNMIGPEYERTYRVDKHGDILAAICIKL